MASYIPCITMLNATDAKYGDTIKTDSLPKNVTFNIDYSNDKGQTWFKFNYGSKPYHKSSLSLLWCNEIRIMPLLNGTATTFANIGITKPFCLFACNTDYRTDTGKASMDSSTGADLPARFVGDEFTDFNVRRMTVPLTFNSSNTAATLVLTDWNTTNFKQQSIAKLTDDDRKKIFDMVGVTHYAYDDYSGQPYARNWDKYKYDDEETNDSSGTYEWGSFYFLMLDATSILLASNLGNGLLPKVSLTNDIQQCHTTMDSGTQTYDVTDIPANIKIYTQKTWTITPTIKGTKQNISIPHKPYNLSKLEYDVNNYVFAIKDTKLTISAQGDFPGGIPTPPAPSKSQDYPNVYTVADEDLGKLLDTVIAKQTVDQYNDIHITYYDMSQYIVNFYKYYGTLAPTSKKQIYVGYVNTNVIGNQISNKPYSIDMGKLSIPNDSSISEIQIYLPFYGLTQMPLSTIGKTISVTYTVSVGSGNGLYSIKADNIQIMTVEATDGYKYPFKFTGGSVGEYSSSAQLYGGLQMYVLATYNKSVKLHVNNATKSEIDEIKNLISSGIEE